MLLSNSVSLSLAIESTVPILQAISGEEIVRTGWKHDPPKALSDVFESVIGAVLVDSGYDYEKTAAVVEYVMDDVLEALSPNIGKDPVTEVVEWAAANGCIKITFEYVLFVFSGTLFILISYCAGKKLRLLNTGNAMASSCSFMASRSWVPLSRAALPLPSSSLQSALFPSCATIILINLYERYAHVRLVRMSIFLV